jgi:hypothetical protein
MHPDNFQQAWQAQSTQSHLKIDAGLLLKEVQRNQREFEAVIFLRDFREVAVALIMIPVWFYLGASIALPWTWYLTVPALVWIAGFMLVYRRRHKQKASKPDEPLLPCVERSLTEVEDQIWLLRNVFWWYLLPPGISILAFFAQVIWLSSHGWLEALGMAGFFGGFLFAVYGFVYWLNQHAIRQQLEPRRQELLGLLASLQEEPPAAEG